MYKDIPGEFTHDSFIDHSRARYASFDWKRCAIYLWVPRIFR